jgi:hypothetical protein
MNPSDEQFPLDREEGSIELLSDKSTTTDGAKHGLTSRAFATIICGVVAGMLIPGALANGCLFYFPEGRHSGTSWLFLWGEHWAIRVLASWASAVGAGFIAGMIARQRGRIWAGIAALPSTLYQAGIESFTSDLFKAVWNRQATSTPALSTYQEKRFSKSAVKSRAFGMARLIYPVFP